jgi:hypothetical protein
MIWASTGNVCPFVSRKKIKPLLALRPSKDRVTPLVSGNAAGLIT